MKKKLIKSTICDMFGDKNIAQLFDCGVITERSALRYLIKAEYWKLIKGSDISTRNAIIDLSIRWEVSETLVKKVIYNTPEIKV